MDAVTLPWTERNKKPDKPNRRNNNLLHHAIILVPTFFVGLASGYFIGGARRLESAPTSESGTDEWDGDEEASSNRSNEALAKLAGKMEPGKRAGGVRKASGSRGAPLRRIGGAASASGSSGGKGDGFVDDGTEVKMVLVVRLDLKMGAGKIAAQCSHAAWGTCQELLKRNQRLLSRYEGCGQPKIVVSCQSLKEMRELQGQAEQAGLPTFTVADAGRTQVAAGSKTVLAIGPGTKTTVDSVTRHLKLL
eukprot:TRINITY_DN35836_c0_g1_i1.p1 TRINITY_DN35836_c0_g1~~TRINITY_DN35836_c0_g1_i1.p1  ORF type:complete len:290 (-),score=37.46 TRINITY_DN35836_c0_g1_i1:269-1015(-)